MQMAMSDYQTRVLAALGFVTERLQAPPELRPSVGGWVRFAGSRYAVRRELESDEPTEAQWQEAERRVADDALGWVLAAHRDLNVALTGLRWGGEE